MREGAQLYPVSPRIGSPDGRGWLLSENHGGVKRTGDVTSDFGDWLKKSPGAPTGGDADYEQFAQQKHVGPRAVQKLKHQQGTDFNGVGEGPKTPAAGPSNYGLASRKKKAEAGVCSCCDQPREWCDCEQGCKHCKCPKSHSKAAQRRQALIAEPDYVWSKSPSTTKVEFANRVGAGVHPEDAYRALIAEITDHHGRGLIDNRDAHRAANEAFGRLLFSRRKAPRKVSQLYPDEVVRQAKLNPKLSWSGWGPEQKQPQRHKVSGWNWDKYLNGYTSTSHRRFECSCGVPVNVPDYHRCKCGRTWNSYVVGTGGDRHQAAAEKFVCREVPEREGMIVANRKKGRDDLKFPTGGYDDYDKRLNDWAHEDETENAWPSDHHPSTPQGKSFPPDWHKRDTRTQQWRS